ncbi:hypothetical protein pipiens_010685 [Culex pipiens pipiens]|uniref:Uncharacterized protein n=1 Tax=Culex pipiens pipiens TaxID=38569 RepID=A0ABD1D988_CULPP
MPTRSRMDAHNIIKCPQNLLKNLHRIIDPDNEAKRAGRLPGPPGDRSTLVCPLFALAFCNDGHVTTTCPVPPPLLR